MNTTFYQLVGYDKKTFIAYCQNQGAYTEFQIFNDCRLSDKSCYVGHDRDAIPKNLEFCYPCENFSSLYDCQRYLRQYIKVRALEEKLNKMVNNLKALKKHHTNPERD